MLNLMILSTWLKSRCTSDRGASLVEYALLVSLIAVVCLVAVTTLGGQVSGQFESLTSEFGG